ncbi:hypothetical protein [Pantoea sp. CTOTU46764]|uniref:DUF7736 domain-containing protein n=1 Tax=Pantoea sp. CTOTU46764 TaxID=2953854 RepID=UPI00289F2E3C|nr:hypothetical protein [Pantoea sp. CTOTU46764]
MNKLTKEQAIILTGFTGILHGSFSDFHGDVENRLGRPVWTHEFVAMSDELKELYRKDFIEMQPNADAPQSPTDTYRQIENDGWIEWKGGKCPEAYSTEIQVKYRDGMGMEDAAGDFSWTHDNEPDDIIAYRVIENDGSAK